MAVMRIVEDRYQETFDAVYVTLRGMAERDSEAAASHIRQTLKSLYVRSGNDWTGRGAIGNAGLDASIAAHESVLLMIKEGLTRQRRKRHETNA